MKLRTTIALTFVALATLSGCEQPMSKQVAEQVETLIAQSELVFSGTVEKLGAATIADIPITDQTAIVRLDEILHAPESFDPYWAGKSITVQLVGPNSLSAGESAVFFTASWLFGESLAVREVGHIAVENAVGQIRRAIPAALDKVADDALVERVGSATLVLVGEVQGTQPAPDTVRIGPLTEHFPDWREATIRISSVELGEYTDSEIRILYPGSTDVMWARSPKFEKGQRGIWILRREKIEGIPMGDYLTTLDPLDFQSEEQLDRVKRAIAGTPKP